MKDNNTNNNELMARLTRRFDGREIVNWNGVEIYIRDRRISGRFRLILSSFAAFALRLSSG